MSLQEGRQQQHSGLLSLKPLGGQKKGWEEGGGGREQETKEKILC